MSRMAALWQHAVCVLPAKSRPTCMPVSGQPEGCSTPRPADRAADFSRILLSADTISMPNRYSREPLCDKQDPIWADQLSSAKEPYRSTCRRRLYPAFSLQLIEELLGIRCHSRQMALPLYDCEISRNKAIHPM